MELSYVHPCFLRGFNELAIAHGGKPAQLMAQVGIDHTLVFQQNGKMPFNQFVELLSLTADTLNIPDIAMRLAKYQDIFVISPLLPILARCSTVQEASEAIMKFFPLIISGGEVIIDHHIDTVQMTFECGQKSLLENKHFQDYTLASAYQITCLFLGKRFPLRSCHFIREASSESEVQQYMEYFDCPVAFGSDRMSLYADSKILQESIEHVVQGLSVRISQYLKENDNADIVENVSRVLNLSLASGGGHIDHVAKTLGYSSRTLQRKLKEKNTRFSSILDSVRFAMANQYLENTPYRLTDISDMLGYSNLSSFSRSYFRWSGVYPEEVRKKAISQMKQFENPSIDLFVNLA